MKSVAITGHTKGIGAALASLMVSEYKVIGFSRSAGYDISVDSDRIVYESEDTDIFVNNAFCNQVLMFEKMYALWQYNKSKTIVNIISRARYDDHLHRHYSNEKRELAKSANCGFMYDRECRIINISPGWVATDSVPEPWLKANNHPYFTAKECAEYILWAIQQPIEIGELALWKN